MCRNIPPLHSLLEYSVIVGNGFIRSENFAWQIAAEGINPFPAWGDCVCRKAADSPLCTPPQWKRAKKGAVKKAPKPNWRVSARRSSNNFQDKVGVWKTFGRKNHTHGDFRENFRFLYVLF